MLFCWQWKLLLASPCDQQDRVEFAAIFYCTPVPGHWIPVSRRQGRETRHFIVGQCCTRRISISFLYPSLFIHFRHESIGKFGWNWMDLTKIAIRNLKTFGLILVCYPIVCIQSEFLEYWFARKAWVVLIPTELCNLGFFLSVIIPPFKWHQHQVKMVAF